MKSCPSCHQNYDDDAMRFCLKDGTPLQSSSDPLATLQMLPTTTAGDTRAETRSPVAEPTQAAPQIQLPSGFSRPVPPEQKSHNLLPLVAVGFVLIGVVGIVSAYLILRSPQPENREAAQVSSSASSSPSTSASDLVAQTEVIVFLTGANEFYVGKTPVEKAEIPDQVRRLSKDTPLEEQVVYVKSMCHVPYGVVASVIDALREAGFERIGLVADKENKEQTKSRASRSEPIHTGVSSNEAITSDTPSRPLLLINVESKTSVRLNDEQMTLSKLRSQLGKLLTGRTDKTVFVQAPENMTYCDVVSVIDVVKAAGAQPIGLQVDD